jgi:hypothetical protein
MKTHINTCSTQFKQKTGIHAALPLLM